MKRQLYLHVLRQLADRNSRFTGVETAGQIMCQWQKACEVDYHLQAVDLDSGVMILAGLKASLPRMYINDGLRLDYFQHTADCMEAHPIVYHGHMMKSR